MKIAMVGISYIGVVCGVCFSDFGRDVICPEKAEARIEIPRNGDVPIFEPGLDVVMARNVAARRLPISTSLSAAVDGSDAVLGVVGSTNHRGGGNADLPYVMEAAAEIGQALAAYTVIVTKYILQVNADHKVAEAVRSANPVADLDVASNPEFLREGVAIDDFMKPDHVVVVFEDERQRLRWDIYGPLYLRNVYDHHAAFDAGFEIIEGVGR